MWTRYPEPMAPGRVDILLTVNEPLQTTPFFSITPDGGVPISINLTKNTDLTYTGFFTITESTPSTTAYAVFSGRDVAGNRGTEIGSGASEIWKYGTFTNCTNSISV
jgi:large repetitive protein